MPPKTTLTELNEGQINFLFSVLKNCSEVKPDWNAVAADNENGIGYARNASGRFKDILKKLGYCFEAGKLSDTDGNDAAPKTPLEVKSIPNRGKSTSAKKRKASAEDADDGEGVGAESEVKATKQEVKKEDAEGDINVVAQAD